MFEAVREQEIPGLVFIGAGVGRSEARAQRPVEVDRVERIRRNRSQSEVDERRIVAQVEIAIDRIDEARIARERALRVERQRTADVRDKAGICTCAAVAVARAKSGVRMVANRRMKGKMRAIACLRRNRCPAENGARRENLSRGVTDGPGRR